MYITICATDRQSRFDAWDRVLGAGALGWPWGMGWGGRGIQDGDTCTPMADSCQRMAKPLQYCKVISLQLKRIIYNNKKRPTPTPTPAKKETEPNEKVSRRACWLRSQFCPVHRTPVPLKLPHPRPRGDDALPSKRPGDEDLSSAPAISFIFLLFASSNTLST